MGSPDLESRKQAPPHVRSPNKRLAQIVAGVMEEMERIFHLVGGPKTATDAMTQEHTDLVEALAAGDRQEAQSLMENHIISSRTRVIECFREGTLQLGFESE